MPIVDLPSLAPSAPVDVPRFAVTPGALPLPEPRDLAENFMAAPEEQRAAKSLAEAAFEQENLLVSAMAAETYGIDRTPDPNFDAWESIKGTRYEPYFDRFSDAQNRPHADAIKRQIDREEENRAIIEAAPLWQSMPLILGAAVLDPTILLPGGAFVRGARGGLSVLRSALNVGTAAAGAVALQEVGLQATQQTRTLAESAINVSASALLGGLLGAGGSALLSRAEWNGLTRGLERELRGEAPLRPPPGDGVGAAPTTQRQAADVVPTRAPGPIAASIGAAAVERGSLDALTIAGRAAGATAKATAFLNPGQRLMQSPSATAREVYLNLSEMTQYIRANERGGATPQAVETLRKQWNAGLAQAVSDERSAWKRYKQRAGRSRMTRDQFDEEIGKALRRGDEHEIPEVAEAARSYRKNIFDPLKDAAIEARLLPEDVTVDTATSYFSRVYKRKLVEADEVNFKRAVSDWVIQSAPRWMQDFDTAAANKLAAAQDKVANAGGDAARETAERALRDLETELRIERDARFGSEEALRARADEVANEVFNKITGRWGDAGGTPGRFTIEARGPLRARTFNMPDELLEPWLESSAQMIARRYHRIMSADVEIARKFGSVDMREQIAAVRADYERLRRGVTDEKELLRLAARERADIRDLEGIRDLLRGTYRINDWERNFGRIARVANMFNYVRQMGMVTVASIPEAYHTAMTHGLRPFMQASMLALRQAKGFKLAVKEARLAGNITERVLAHRLATLAEIGDFYTSRGPVEKFMANLTEIASTWNGVRIWTDSMRMIAAVATENRLLDAAVNFTGTTKANRRYLAWAGINEADAAGIAAKFDEFGETVDGVRVANTEKWVREGVSEVEQARDRYLVRTFRAALNKDIDTQVVTRSVADIPLFANTPLGKILFQFNSFNLASHQRVLLRGLQEGPARAVSAIIGMTALGMLVTYLRAVSANRVDQLPDFADNPGWWIANGFDQSGLAMVPMQLANAVELLTGINPVKAPVQMFDEEQAQSARLRNRNVLSALGPTAGLLSDLQSVGTIPATVMAGNEITRGQKGAAERLLPFSSYIGMRQLLRYVINPPD